MGAPAPLSSCCCPGQLCREAANSLTFPVVTGLASSIRLLIDDGTDGLTKEAIGIAIAIHRKYGPKLLENAYLRPYLIDLRAAGHTVECQPRLALVHGGVTIQNAYRPDIIVDRKLVIEVKVENAILPVHKQQLSGIKRLILPEM